MPPKSVPSSTPKPATPMINPEATTLRVQDFSKLGEFVTFIIGPKNAKFFVHKTFSCDASPVLKAAFNSTFVEGETQTYTLEDTTEDTFTLLSQFLYTQKLDGTLGGKGKAVPGLYRLLVLAEKLLMPRLQNIAIDRINQLREQENVIYTPMLQYVWDNTTSDSPLRRLFISHCVCHLAADKFCTHIQNFPKEMLAEICVHSREYMISVQSAPSRNMADYHVKEE